MQIWLCQSFFHYTTFPLKPLLFPCKTRRERTLLQCFPPPCQPQALYSVDLHMNKLSLVPYPRSCFAFEHWFIVRVLFHSACVSVWERRKLLKAVVITVFLLWWLIGVCVCLCVRVCQQQQKWIWCQINSTSLHVSARLLTFMDNIFLLSVCGETLFVLLYQQSIQLEPVLKGCSLSAVKGPSHYSGGPAECARLYRIGSLFYNPDAAPHHF